MLVEDEIQNYSLKTSNIKELYNPFKKHKITVFTDYLTVKTLLHAKQCSVTSKYNIDT